MRRRLNPDLVAYLQAPDRYPWVHQSATPPVYPGLQSGKQPVPLNRWPEGLPPPIAAPQQPMSVAEWQATLPMGPTGAVEEMRQAPAPRVPLSAAIAPPISDLRPDPAQAPWGMAPSQPILSDAGRQVGRFDSGVAPAGPATPEATSEDAALRQAQMFARQGMMSRETLDNYPTIAHALARQDVEAHTPTLAEALVRLVFGNRQQPSSAR